MQRCQILLCVIAWMASASVTAQDALIRADAAAITAEAASASVAAREIDRLLREEAHRELPAGMTLAPRTTDSVFLRRVFLDLIGQHPAPAEISLFALDPSPDKRAKKIERLLADVRYGTNWARYWRDVILYRRTMEQSVALVTELEPYLAREFNRGAGWDHIARDFITAEGSTAEHGETALFVAQFAEPVDVAAETSRIFLGIQIQCAQCHDHPTDRWKREQFHEFAAFFPRVFMRRSGQGATGRPSMEVAANNAAPMFRRTGQLGQAAREHFMPDLKNPASQGALMVPVFFATGQKLETGIVDEVRRQALADWLTSPENPWFAKAVVNRIWAELLGEGFYDPVDDIGPDRVCSAPRTLDYLAAGFVAHKHDLKWLFSTIMQTEAYQRESRSRRNPDQPPFTANIPQRLRADQLVDVLSAALGVELDGGRAAAAASPNPAPFGQGPRGVWIQNFGFDPSMRRDQVASSIPQALMLMNSGNLSQMLNARFSRSSLAQLAASDLKDEDIVFELYLRCLAREPNAKETELCLEHIKSGDRFDGIEDVMWSLINSEELRFRK